jgi:hypothetical protein
MRGASRAIPCATLPAAVSVPPTRPIYSERRSSRHVKPSSTSEPPPSPCGTRLAASPSRSPPHEQGWITGGPRSSPRERGSCAAQRRSSSHGVGTDAAWSATRRAPSLRRSNEETRGWPAIRGWRRATRAPLDGVDSAMRRGSRPLGAVRSPVLLEHIHDDRLECPIAVRVRACKHDVRRPVPVDVSIHEDCPSPPDSRHRK